MATNRTSSTARRRVRRNPDLERDRKFREEATNALAETIFLIREGGNDVELTVGMEQYDVTGGTFVPVNTVRLSVQLANGVIVTLHDASVCKDGGETFAAYCTVVDRRTGKEVPRIHVYGLSDSKYMDIPAVRKTGKHMGMKIPVSQKYGEDIVGLPGVVYMKIMGSDALRVAMTQALANLRADSFLHEYIHYLDEQRFGKRKPGVWERLAKKAQQSRKEYVSSPVEVNAFYQQGISAVERMLFKAQQINDRQTIERVLNNTNTFIDVIERLNSGFSGVDPETGKRIRKKAIQRNFHKRLGMDFVRLREEFGLQVPVVKKIGSGKAAKTVMVIPPPLVQPVVVENIPPMPGVADTPPVAAPAPVQPPRPAAVIPAPRPVAQPVFGRTPGLPLDGERKPCIIDEMYHFNGIDANMNNSGVIEKNGREYTLTFSVTPSKQYKFKTIRADPNDPKAYRASISPPVDECYAIKIRLV